MMGRCRICLHLRLRRDAYGHCPACAESLVARRAAVVRTRPYAGHVPPRPLPPRRPLPPPGRADDDVGALAASDLYPPPFRFDWVGRTAAPVTTPDPEPDRFTGGGGDFGGAGASASWDSGSSDSGSSSSSSDSSSDSGSSSDSDSSDSGSGGDTT